MSTAVEEQEQKAQAPIQNNSRKIRTTLMVGLDLGTNCSCVKVAAEGCAKSEQTFTIPTIVGYAKENIVAGVLPGDRSTFFGEEALHHRLHLQLINPLEDGVVGDSRAARDYLGHIRSLVDPEGKNIVKAVIGMPANTTAASRDHLREVATGIFESILLIPEPFLAALGVREESRIGTNDYIDPVNNSMFIDIGAGTTDLCLIQGYYPSSDDQISIPYAGDAIDEDLAKLITDSYPDTKLSTLKIREIKEKYSHVGKSGEAMEFKVIVGGKPRILEVSEQVNTACTSLLDKVHECLMELIARVSSDSVEETLKNIIITGGGSQIDNIAEELQIRLVEEGYDEPHVRTLGKNFKELVSLGAFKAATQARPNQWQHLVG